MKPLLWTLLSLTWGTATAAPVDRIAAVVNGEVITLSEVYELGRDHIEQASVGGSSDVRRTAEILVLDAEIRRLLISQELDRMQITVTDQEISRQVDAIAADNGMTREQLVTAVEGQGLAWDQYLEDVRTQSRYVRFRDYVIRPRIVENEDELRNAYNRMANSPDRPTEVELGAIYVGFRSGDETESERVRGIVAGIKARIEAGESFAKLASEFDMAGYGQAGGKMGTYKQGELMGDLDGPAFTVAEGKLSDPIATDRGYYLLEIRKRGLQQVLPCEVVRDNLSQQIYQAQFVREEDNWYQKTRREASVEIKLEEPDSQ